MQDKDLKVVNTKITNDIYKKIKILSVTKEISFADMCRELLEKSIRSKKLEEVETTM